MDEIFGTLSSLSLETKEAKMEQSTCDTRSSLQSQSNNVLSTTTNASSNHIHAPRRSIEKSRLPSTPASPQHRHNHDHNHSMIHSPGSLSPTSPTSSTGSTPGRHSKADVVQALAAARRKRSLSSPTKNGSDDTSGLNLPTLHQESRNDQERQRRISPSDGATSNSTTGATDTSTDLLLHGNSEYGELEVSLQPSFQYVVVDDVDDDEIGGGGGEEENKTNGASPTTTSTSLSPETFEKKMAAIILEAKLASMKVRQPTPPKSRDLILQEALDRAAAQSRAAAAEAISVGSGLTQQQQQQRAAEKAKISEGFIPRSTQQQPSMHRSPVRPPRSSLPPRSPLPPNAPMTPVTPVVRDPDASNNNKLHQYLSPASSVCSIDDYETAVTRLPTSLTESDELPREEFLRRLDGVETSSVVPVSTPLSPPVAASNRTSTIVVNDMEEDNSILAAGTITNTKKVKKVKTVVIGSMETPGNEKPEESSPYPAWMSFCWGGSGGDTPEATSNKEDSSDSMAPISCGRHRRRLSMRHEELPAMATSLVRVASDPMTAPYYAEVVNEKRIDPRMPDWIDNQFSIREELPKDGTYHLGESRTVIVHEILRGSWTWCTAWSPDGKFLAIGTENHRLAVVDTCSSSVWRVRHDKKVTGPPKQDTTHSIRSIAWGTHFIAIGGVGNAVEILAPNEPYHTLHTITGTGFVGSLDWLTGAPNTLLIGSRIGKAMVVKIWAQEKTQETSAAHHKDIQSMIVSTVDKQKAWVNAVKFSPGGSAFVVGDSKGILGVYSFEDKPGSPVAISNIANFKLEDSILDVEWSPDGQWLYAGGEDFVVTVINTQGWEAVHRIKRDRWVQFISSSLGGSHVAVGGVSSEVTILDVDRGWDTALKVSLKGLVPLSAKWHPQDQYLVLTGQNNSVLAVETTNARHVSGHFLRSVSPIFSIEFSPDGRMAAIGNEAGVVTIFKLSGTTFITTYELVLDCDGEISIEWSLNGAYLAVVAGSKVVIVARSSSLPGSAPPNASGFYVAKVVRDLGMMHDVAIDPQSRFVAVSGVTTRILDATANFKCIREIECEGVSQAISWSPDGTWLATIGKNQSLLIYDASPESPSQWRVVFTVQMKQPGLALTWGPPMLGGLQYCAYGGKDKKVYIMEIRTKERTWETVLGIPRDGVIHDLDWNNEGLVAAAIGNGTVTVMDLSYLQSGWAVNEMDYNWQRQALTCFTEIRRNKGKNCMKSVRWIPSAPGSDSLLAVGGTDGEVEIVDLTERQRCSGFSKVTASV